MLERYKIWKPWVDRHNETIQKVLEREKKPVAVTINRFGKLSIVRNPPNNRVDFGLMEFIDGEKKSKKKRNITYLDSNSLPMDKTNTPTYICVEGIPFPVDPRWFVAADPNSFAKRLNEYIEEKAVISEQRAKIDLLKKPGKLNIEWKKYAVIAIVVVVFVWMLFDPGMQALLFGGGVANVLAPK